jgi:hypothetical protein
MIDPGIDHDLQWVCFIVATGECWTYLNKDIRMVDNETMGRKRAAFQPPQAATDGQHLGGWLDSLVRAASAGAPPRPER